MYKTCPQCGYFSEETSESACPSCQSGLRLTMLPPTGASPSTSVAVEEIAVRPRSEAMELPPAVRLAQIGTGIVIFFAVSRWGVRILTLLIGEEVEIDTTAQAAYLYGYTAFLYIAAALAGGAVAGAWSVNWVPQGIGVGLGVLAIPLLVLIMYRPESLLVYLVGVAVTTVLTVLGALLGHKLVRPSQFYS